MVLTSPAYATLVAAVFLGIVVLLPRNIKVYDPETDKVQIVEYSLKSRLVMLILLSIPMIVHIYAINCMVSGQCHLFAWVVATLLILWIIAFILIAFM